MEAKQAATHNTCSKNIGTPIAHKKIKNKKRQETKIKEAKQAATQNTCGIYMCIYIYIHT
jgi:penicillin-binding protein-related factor A (putative recombinase)